MSLIDNAPPTFGITDYCVFAAMLVISLGIGVVTSLKGNKTPEDYLLGNRSFKPIPISMSLLTSIVSSISLLGFSGEAYAYGLQFSLVVAGIVLALVFCCFFTLPVLFPLRLTSVNEYIEMRFNSKRLRSFVLLLSCLQAFLYAGICLYAPTIALSAVTPFSTTTYVYLLGVVCTLYSTIGGIKAVVWTDVFQLVVVVIGLAVIVILGCFKVGGLTNVWTIAEEGGRFDVFNMDLGLYGRHTLPNVVLHGFFYFLALYGVSQINVQRMSCLQSMKDAKIVLFSNIIGYLIVYFLIFTSGIMCYATYVGCDPLKQGLIDKSDQILSFFVIDKLGYIIGLPGLFVATIIGGALSSVSSVISAMVSMIWKDCLLHFEFFEKASPPVAAVINKIMSSIVGISLIGMALWASNTKSLLEITLAVSGASFGPILGIFLLGIFFPKCNTTGAWCGLITSWSFVCWITVGGFMYREKSNPLPVSIENCTQITINSTSNDFARAIYIQNETVFEQDSMSSIGPQDEFEQTLMWFYGISTTMYPAIGPIMCVIVGLFASFCTGSEKIKNISPLLITPCMRSFYWDKKELQEIEMVKVEITSNDTIKRHENGNIERLNNKGLSSRLGNTPSEQQGNVLLKAIHQRSY